MKTEFVLYKENSDKPIIVNENTNKALLQRCQDIYFHKNEIKYFPNKKCYQKIGITNFLNKKLIVHYKLKDVSQDMKKYINKLNNFDNLLYEYILTY